MICSRAIQKFEGFNCMYAFITSDNVSLNCFPGATTDFHPLHCEVDYLLRPLGHKLRL